MRKIVQSPINFTSGASLPWRIAPHYSMLEVKDTLRSRVRMSFEGLVYKTFRGPKAAERFANEVRVLRHLQERGCPFIPPWYHGIPERLEIVTRSCGSRVEHLDKERAKALFAELETYGVRHDDPDMRNVTYRQSDGRFCIIDFEFATILPERRPNDAAPLCRPRATSAGPATQTAARFAPTTRIPSSPSNSMPGKSIGWEKSAMRKRATIISSSR